MAMKSVLLGVLGQESSLDQTLTDLDNANADFLDSIEQPKKRAGVSATSTSPSTSTLLPTTVEEAIASPWPWLLGLGVLGAGAFVAYKVAKRGRKRRRSRRR